MIKAIIIEDEKWSRTVLKAFGEWDKLGISLVGEASDGEEGLALIERLNPDIIITDMNMPNIDGVEILKQLHDRHSEAKIIVISGYDLFDYMRQAIKSKAFEYLLKPIDASELNRVLGNCVKEIYLQHKSDFTLAYQQMEKQLMEYLVEQRRQLTQVLREKNYLLAERQIRELKKGLPSKKEDEMLLVRLVDDTLTTTIQENILLPSGKDEAVHNAYRKLKKDAEKGIVLDTYMDSLLNVIKIGIDLHNQVLEDEKKPMVVQVKDYIDRQYAENISLEKIARQFYTSKEYLSAAFKQRYKCNMSQYILQLKMEEAKRMIERGVALSQVAERLSYSDVHYFYKVFKKYFNASPKDMKTQYDEGKKAGS